MTTAMDLVSKLSTSLDLIDLYDLLNQLQKRILTPKQDWALVDCTEALATGASVTGMEAMEAMEVTEVYMGMGINIPTRLITEAMAVDIISTTGAMVMVMGRDLLMRLPRRLKEEPLMQRQTQRLTQVWALEDLVVWDTEAVFTEVVSMEEVSTEAASTVEVSMAVVSTDVACMVAMASGRSNADYLNLPLFIISFLVET